MALARKRTFREDRPHALLCKYEMGPSCNCLNHISLVRTAFASRLEDQLKSGTVLPSLLTTIRPEIDKAISLQNATAASQRIELDFQGTKLWNLVSKSRAAKEDVILLCHGTSSSLSLRKAFPIAYSRLQYAHLPACSWTAPSAVRQAPLQVRDYRHPLTGHLTHSR